MPIVRPLTIAVPIVRGHTISFVSAWRVLDSRAASVFGSNFIPKTGTKPDTSTNQAVLGFRLTLNGTRLT